MTGPVWLVLLLAAGLVSVVWWLIVDWRRDVRQAKAAARTAHDFFAPVGRHRDLESDDRTEPLFGEAPSKQPRQIPVQELLTRTEGEGSALRLNWRREDEQRARGADEPWTAGDFPTAVLPIVTPDAL
ncbi:hypothetical protein [Kibdelosporangium aridum]|uniref:Uncharacterized protein n=1 Tax=Kibdelosporangium aridum TaxID=2030 RepID=A0A1Y5XS39_KIBAR|nr:hypothetical protein [Kibdelosporangium aridum]SMD14567.1 hypothetical protein SAMN05661093_05070 [Kibdelosporangium aridum]